MSVGRTEACPECEGKGYHRSTISPCPMCDGTGKLEVSIGSDIARLWASRAPLPCPWCGEVPELRLVPRMVFETLWRMHCENPSCPVRPTTKYYSFHTPEEALVAWAVRAMRAKAAGESDAND